MSYPHLAGIVDPAARTAVKLIYDRLSRLEATQNALLALVSPTADVEGNTQRVINLADPQAGGDAVNLRTLRMQITAAFTKALQILGVSRTTILPH